MADGPDQVVVDFGLSGGPSVGVPLVRGGCWSSLLGGWLLPDRGGIALLDRAIGDLSGSVDAVRITGCASSALLPIVWCRSIWFDRGTPIVLSWTPVEDPRGDASRQAAGLLACELADEVVCSDVVMATSDWGYRSPGGVGRAFDLLGALLDCWDDAPASTDWTDAMGRALARCASLGHRRIALYGAGTHTRLVGEVLADPPVEIVGVIDDDDRRHGDRLWGYPIISRASALTLGLDAVILSANSMEDLLWARSEPLRAAGVSVIRLYGAADAVETFAGLTTEVA